MLFLCILLGGGAWAVGQVARPTSRPTVASMVPAATDLLLAMGAQNHLVAVGNYDAERAELRGLPRAGDYLTIDWEQLIVIRPEVLLIQNAEDKIVPGTRRRASELSVRLVNLQISRLADVFKTIEQLGKAIGEEDQALRLTGEMHGQLERVRTRVTDQEAVSCLICLDAEARSVVGPNNFLDDLLTLAGGKNAGAELGKDFPQIDGEKLLDMRPAAMIFLMPGATEQQMLKLRDNLAHWQAVPAIRDRRVLIITDAQTLLPGSQVGQLAERFAGLLHPEPKKDVP